MKKWILSILSLVCISFLFAGCGELKKPDGGFFLKTQLANAKVGIVNGLTSEDLVKQEIANPKISTYSTVNDAVAALKDHKLDALVLDAKNAKKIIETDGKVDQMAEKLVDRQYMAATLMPDTNPDHDFTLEIGATISRIQSNGVYDKLYQKYFSENASDPDTSDLTYYGGKVKNRTLVVGVAEDNKPFSYKDKNGRYVGFDVEFANEIAKYWGAKLEIRAYPRENLLNVAQSGEVKLALGRFTSFDDKDPDDMLFFSLPYYDASQDILLNSEDVGKSPI